MALVQVRAKATETNPTPSDDVIAVDEAWLERWPDDFELVDGEPTAAPTPAKTDAKAAPAAQQPVDASDSRSRF